MKPPLCTSSIFCIATTEASLSFWIIAALIAFLGLVCYFGFLELERFTGGKYKKLEELDKTLAEKLDALHLHPERLRMAARFSIFICPIAAVLIFLYGLPSSSKTLEPLPLIIASALLAIGFLAAEIIAARTSIVANAKILCFFTPIFTFFSYLLFPFVWLVERHAQVLEAQGETQNVNTTEDEILSLIDKKDEGEKTAYVDDIEEVERRIVTGAFELDDTTVHEIMTPRVDIDAISADSDVNSTIKLILKSGHSRIPVYKESIDQIIGVIYAKDLLNKEKVYTAKSLTDLVHPPYYTPETKKIGDLLAEFQKNKTHFAIVIDEYGGTSGIVTFEDILEELVGEIQDEYDIEEAEQPQWKPDANGWYTMDARTPISDINDNLDLNLPDSNDYDTIGGYLADAAGKILKEGETQTTDIVEIAVLEATPRVVEKIKLRPVMNEEE